MCFLQFSTVQVYDNWLFQRMDLMETDGRRLVEPDRPSRQGFRYTYVQTEQKGVQVYDRRSRQGYRYMTDRADRDLGI